VNTQALYVYKTIEFEIQGVIEPLLLASGKPAGGQISGDALLDPGLYRVPATTELFAVTGSVPQDFEVQDLSATNGATPNGSSSKGGSGDPPPHQALVMLAKPGESTDQTQARIIAITNGQGKPATVTPPARK
jgi:hypothetical protein